MGVTLRRWGKHFGLDAVTMSRLERGAIEDGYWAREAEAALREYEEKGGTELGEVIEKLKRRAE